MYELEFCFGNVPKFHSLWEISQINENVFSFGNDVPKCYYRGMFSGNEKGKFPNESIGIKFRKCSLEVKKECSQINEMVFSFGNVP